MRTSAAERAGHEESPHCSAVPVLIGSADISTGYGNETRTGTRWRVEHERLRSGNSLSSREREVLHWLALGKSGPEIAIILGISTCTVRIHIQGVKRKLNAVNIPHAVYIAFVVGILRRVTALPPQPA